MEPTPTTPPGVISGTVIDAEGSNNPIRNATVHVFSIHGTGRRAATPSFQSDSDQHGQYRITGVPPAAYVLRTDAFGHQAPEERIEVTPDGPQPVVCLRIPIGFKITTHAVREDGEDPVSCDQLTAGTTAVFRVEYNGDKSPLGKKLRVEWHPDLAQVVPSPGDATGKEVRVSTVGLVGLLRIKATLKGSPEIDAHGVMNVMERPAQPISGTVSVNLRRSATHRTPDQPLWVLIRNRTRAISFSGTGVAGPGYSGYGDFIDRVLCKGGINILPNEFNATRLRREINELGTHVHGVAAYELLKTATEVFLLLECGVKIDQTSIDQASFDPDDEAGRLGEPISLQEIRRRLGTYLGDARLPYIDRVILAAFPGSPKGSVYCPGVLTSRADEPCLLELIWSYWHEEGMLAQSINAVSRRFQNVRGPGDRDPLAHLEIDPLRPLNNLLWGHIQGEWNRLTVKRRAYEYDHHYGLTLYGKAVASFLPADSRSKFLEGFHNLLYVCSVFFKEDNDTTVIADGYPLLNALKEVHLLLAQGAHNQFGDLPWTARAEMLIQEWLLARPEMRDFLQSRAMVPYKEPWMPQVDTMKTLQGWSDVTVTHFRDLGVYGEQLLLSIRYGDWIDINDEDSAKNWARYWRPEIQGYLHGYRAVTGVDLTNPDTVDSTMPSVHLQKRLASQRTR